MSDEHPGASGDAPVQEAVEERGVDAPWIVVAEPEPEPEPEPAEAERAGRALPGTRVRVLAAPLPFFHRLRAFADEAALANPLVQAVFPREDFVDVCRHAGDPALARVADAIDRGRVDYGRAIAAGFLQQLRLYFLGFDVVVEDQPLHFANPLPVAELHCPHVRGARASFRAIRSRTQALTLDLSIGVLGAAAEYRSEVTVEGAVETREECVAIVTEVSGSSSLWRHLDTGQTRTVLHVTGVSAFLSALALEEDDVRLRHHTCARADSLEPYKAALRDRRAVVNRDYWFVHPASRRASAGAGAGAVTLDSKVTVSRERAYEWTWNLALPSPFETEVGLKIVSRWKRAVELSYSLPQGPAYLGLFQSERGAPFYWAWQPAADGGTPAPRKRARRRPSA